MAVLGMMGGAPVSRQQLTERLAELRQALLTGRGRLADLEEERTTLLRGVAQAEGAVIETERWLAILAGQGKQEGQNGETSPEPDGGVPAG